MISSYVMSSSKFSNVFYMLAIVISSLMVPAIHEFVKALLSTILGDTIPKNEGKLTLNPMVHIDTLGFMFGLFHGYAWGNPINTSSRKYKYPKLGSVIVYTVPTLINFLLATISIIILYKTNLDNLLLINPIAGFIGGNHNNILSDLVFSFLHAFAYVNFLTGAFHLIPAPPTDMSSLINSLIPPKIRLSSYNDISKVLNVLLIFLIFWGMVKIYVTIFWGRFLVFIISSL